MKNKLILLSSILWVVITMNAQKFDPTWESLDTRKTPEWFCDAKFGIFIHWGVYSVPAWRKVESGKYASYAEWYYARVMNNKANGGYDFHVKNYGKDFEYRDFAPMFKAELFDPDFWADLFVESGARYVVLTSKHHDGYCLWPTKSAYKKNWNSMDIGPQRDLVGEITTAVRKKGLKMGLYYSIPEWESISTSRTKTGYFIDTMMVKKYRIPTDQYVDNHMIPQLKELVTQYQPAVIFADAGEWDFGPEFWKTREFLAWLYNESPNKDEVVVNDRFCKGMPGKHGDYFSSEYKDADTNAFRRYWEESRGVGGSYGYNRAENLNDYSTSEELIHELIDIVSRGGNLLLNVGPTADGRIPVIMQERLSDIGNWLDVNGEAIYGTRKNSVSNEEYQGRKIYYTKKGDTLFAFITSWFDDLFVINLPDNKSISSVKMLGCDQEIKWRKEGNGLYITPPVLTINNLPCLYAWVFQVN
jgi:alpha-L-fucosidase